MRYRFRPSVLVLAALGLLAALLVACGSPTVSSDQPTPVTATLAAASTATVPIPTSTPASTPTPDHHYAVMDESMTWTEAKTYCEKQSAHLAAITSAEEQEAVTALLLSTGAKKNYWLGGTKENGQWKWITDESFSYTHWAPGEPNSAAENFIEMIGKNNGRYPTPGVWDDIKNDGANDADYILSTFGLICEWGR